MLDNVVVLPVKVAPPRPKIYFRIGSRMYELEIKARLTPVPQEGKKAEVIVMPKPSPRSRRKKAWQAVGTRITSDHERF